MSTKRRMPLQNKLHLSRTWILFLGLLAAFMGYRMLSFELRLRSYEHSFLQMPHPSDTTWIDSLRFEVNYYPATYVDASIDFSSTFLIGEIRSYTGTWDSLKKFYADKKLETWEMRTLSLWILPLEMQSVGQKNWFDFPNDFSYDPFQVDVLRDLQDIYDSTEITRNGSGAEKKFYLVYATVDP